VPPRRVVKKPYFFAVQKLLERCRNLDSELPAGQKTFFHSKKVFTIRMLERPHPYLPGYYAERASRVRGPSRFKKKFNAEN
jgi:hypothetical protein